MSDARKFLEAANGRLTYLQILNEPLGAGRYDSVRAVYGDQAVHHWFDTIFTRFYNLRNEVAQEIEAIISVGAGKRYTGCKKWGN